MDTNKYIELAAAGKNASRPVLSYAYNLNLPLGYGLISSDGFRFHVCWRDAEPVLKPVKLKYSQGTPSDNLENNSFASLLEIYLGAIDTTNYLKLNLNPRQLELAINSARVFARDSADSVKLTWHQGTLFVSGKSAERGESSTAIHAQTNQTHDNTAYSISIQGKALLEGLKGLGDSVNLSGKKRIEQKQNDCIPFYFPLNDSAVPIFGTIGDRIALIMPMSTGDKTQVRESLTIPNIAQNLEPMDRVYKPYKYTLKKLPIEKPEVKDIKKLPQRGLAREFKHVLPQTIYKPNLSLPAKQRFATMCKDLNPAILNFIRDYQDSIITPDNYHYAQFKTLDFLDRDNRLKPLYSLYFKRYITENYEIAYTLANSRNSGIVDSIAIDESKKHNMPVQYVSLPENCIVNFDSNYTGKTCYAIIESPELSNLAWINCKLFDIENPAQPVNKHDISLKSIKRLVSTNADSWIAKHSNPLESVSLPANCVVAVIEQQTCKIHYLLLESPEISERDTIQGVLFNFDNTLSRIPYEISIQCVVRLVSIDPENWMSQFIKNTPAIVDNETTTPDVLPETNEAKNNGDSPSASNETDLSPEIVVQLPIGAIVETTVSDSQLRIDSLSRADDTDNYSLCYNAKKVDNNLIGFGFHHSEIIRVISYPQPDNMPDDSPAIVETETTTPDVLPETNEAKNKNPGQLLADAVLFSSKNYPKAKATYPQNKTLIEIAYISAMRASVTGESVNTQWIDDYELEFKTWSNKMLVNSLITKQLVSRRKTEFETLQYKINSKGLAAIYSAIIYSDKLTDCYQNARNYTGVRNVEKLEDSYLDALEAYEAKNNTDSPLPVDEAENMPDLPVVVMNADIIRPDAEFFTQSIEIEPDPTPDPEPTGTAETDDSPDEDKNTGTYAEQLPQRHNPTRPAPLQSIQAGKWYLITGRWWHSTYTIPVYVRKVSGNQVYYHDSYLARYADEDQDGENVQPIQQFQRMNREAIKPILDWWADIPLTADTYALRELIQSGQRLERSKGKSKPGLIPLKSITFTFSESSAIDTPVTVDSWQEADSIIRKAAKAKIGAGYDKTDFTVIYDDGDEEGYNGRYDIGDSDDNGSLAAHMWGYQSNACNASWWFDRNPENYYASDKNKESSAEFILKYDLDGWNDFESDVEMLYIPLAVPAIPRPEDKKPEALPESPYDDRRPPTKEERQALTARTIDRKETIKLIRADLKATFPGVKFSVKQERSTYSPNISVHWFDGPAESAVKHLLGKYKSKSFDGMDDSTHYHYWIVDGELVQYSGGYKSANRCYSYEFYKRIADEVARENGINESQYEIIAPDSSYKWTSARLNNVVYLDGPDNLGTLIWRKIKDTDASQPEAQAEAENNSTVLEPLPEGEKLSATFYGSIWEITGDTKPHKDTIKQASKGGQLRVRFDKWRKLWTVSGCETLPASLANLCTVETPAQDESLKTETLRAARWGNVWRIWGDTKPVKDVIKANGGKWNGNQWLINSEILPDALRALFDEDDDPTPPTPPSPETDSFDFGTWGNPPPAQTTEEESPLQGDSPLPVDEAQNKGDSAMAEKILSIAESYTQKIEDLRADRLTNTHKRATQDRNNRNEAQYLDKFQSVLVNLAAQHEAGTVPELLQKLTTKTALYYLFYHGLAPSRTIHKNRIQDLMTPELKPAENLLIHKIKGRAEGNKLDSQYGWFYDEELPTLRAIERKAKKLNKYMPDSLDYERMLNAGITESNYKEARESLRALADESAGQESAQDKLKRLNSELIGRKISGYFPTPESLVERMLNRAGVYSGDSVLEPSAGAGHILDHLPEGVNSTAYEIVSSLCEIARAKGHTIENVDFLSIEPTPVYDFVLMNPPFENFQDVDHVRHAYKSLKPGGRLVAIMSESGFFRKDEKAKNFRDWLDIIGESEQLPDGSFLDSDRSTGVKTRLVTIDKPQSAPAPAPDEDKNNGTPETIENKTAQEESPDQGDSPLPVDEAENNEGLYILEYGPYLPDDAIIIRQRANGEQRQCKIIERCYTMYIKYEVLDLETSQITRINEDMIVRLIRVPSTPKSDPEPPAPDEDENKGTEPEFAPYEDNDSPGWKVDYMAIDWESGKILAHFQDRVEKEDYKALRSNQFQNGRGSTTFYAAYSPHREKFLMETFDFKTLYEEDGPNMRERAENRSDRYSGYSTNAGKRAESRFGTADGIASRIPFGQPILVGHHSERHARRDQDKIHNNMRKGIEESEKSAYWGQRASASLSRVDRREKPGATRRRIDRLEADLRKILRRMDKSDKPWASDSRWQWFYENRLSFENALLGDVPDDERPLIVTSPNLPRLLLVEVEL